MKNLKRQYPVQGAFQLITPQTDTFAWKLLKTYITIEGKTTVNRSRITELAPLLNGIKNA